MDDSPPPEDMDEGDVFSSTEHDKIPEHSKEADNENQPPENKKEELVTEDTQTNKNPIHKAEKPKSNIENEENKLEDDKIHRLFKV